MSKGFLTIAYGSKKYIRMGKALARSIRLYNSQTPIAVVTDSPDPELESLFDAVIPLNPQYGSGVEQKLYVDKYTPYDYTIFIDSDCLAYRNPDILWETYEKYPYPFGIMAWGFLGHNDSHYSVIDLGKYLTQYGVDKIPAFNSGLFYFNLSRAAIDIFTTARSLAADKNLKAHKNSLVNDEPVLAMAMALNENPPLPWDDCQAMSTALGSLRGHYSINVLKGQSGFVTDNYYVEPVIIHFNMQCQDYYIYRRDLIRLEHCGVPFIGFAANFLALPGWAGSRFEYYFQRARQRLKKYGFLGLLMMPERWLMRQ